MSIVRKHSRKRDAILECLRCTTSHPTAEWVYNQLKPTIPDLSLATVYRNLAMFKAEGTIDSVGGAFTEFVGEEDLVLSPFIYWAVEHGTSVFKDLRKTVYLIKNRGKK